MGKIKWQDPERFQNFTIRCPEGGILELEMGDSPNIHR